MNGVIYARYSCEKQTENSILGQVRECKEFAKKNGIEIINIYKDEAISGRTATKRPSFMKMINDATSHLFDCVIVWKGDRFSRSRADAAKYKAELKRLGIRVLSATEANVTGPEAVLMDGINEAFAEYFSVELAAKVERGMTQNAIEGKFNGGKPPMGYKVENGIVKLDEENAPIVKQMFELYANSSLTISDVRDYFNNRGITFKGKPLRRSAIYRMFHNTRYYGHYEFKGTSNDNMFPAIVSKEVWDKVNSKVELTMQRTTSYKAKQDYILSGKLVCGECKTYMTGNSGHSKSGKEFFYYTCPGKKQKGCDLGTFPKQELEDVVIDCVIDFIWSKDDIDKYVRMYMDSAKKTVNFASTKASKALQDTKTKLANLTAAIEQGADFSALIPRINELTQIKAEQERELAKLRIESGAFDEESVRHFLNNLRLRDYLNEKDKKYLISVFIDTIYLFKDKTMRFLFNFTGNDGECCKSVRLESRSGHQSTLYTNTDIYCDGKLLGITIDLKPYLAKIRVKLDKKKNH